MLTWNPVPLLLAPLAPLLLACLVVGPIRAEVDAEAEAPPPRPAGALLQRSLSQASIDFSAGVARARGLGPRSGVGDPARAAAETSLKALLYTHPIGEEIALGDLAAAEPALGVALDLQLGSARELSRRAVPPDFDDVEIEVGLGDLLVALAPFVSRRPPDRSPPLRDPDEPRPDRILLLLPPGVAAGFLPPLIPSIRALGGGSALPAAGAWLGALAAGRAVTYLDRPAAPLPGDRILRAASRGGLGGATVYLRDDDAELLAAWLSTPEPPPLVLAPVGDAPEPASGPATRAREPAPPREPTGRPTRPPPASRRRRQDRPPREAPETAARRNPIPESPDAGFALVRPEARTRTRPDPAPRDPRSGPTADELPDPPEPSDPVAERLAAALYRLREADPSARSPPRTSGRIPPLRAPGEGPDSGNPPAAASPPSPGAPAGEAPDQAGEGWQAFPEPEPEPAAPARSTSRAGQRWSGTDEAGEPPGAQGEPGIHWEFFDDAAQQEEGELPPGRRGR